MSVEEIVNRTDDNHTFQKEGSTWNFTDYVDTNVTQLDANATKIDSFYFYKTEQFTVLWLLFAMIVVGNIAVLIGLQWGKRRKTRMDFFIKQLAFAVFILCWSPYIVFDLLQVFGYLPKTQTVVAVATFIQSLTTLNSAANPIIYCLFSTSFCKTVRNAQVISWVSGWCATNPHHCFGTGAPNSSTRTTVTTSLTAQSSRRSGHIAMLHSTSRKRVMVSLV